MSRIEGVVLLSKFILYILILFGIILTLFIAISSIANYFFDRSANKEVENLLSKSGGTDKKIIEEADINSLPSSVQKWLEFSQVLGKERIATIKVDQKAEMRLNKDQSWMPLTSRQYFTTDEPGFIWIAKIKAAPLIHIVGKDKYVSGKGNMLIKIMSLITVADGKGKEVDQGTLLRFLAEAVWFPTAALEDYINWEKINDNSAKATMIYGDVKASGIFTFGDNGEVKNFTAERFKEQNGEYSLETWSIDVSAYRDFSGIKIPTKGEVIWKLADGDFNWYNFEVLNVKYN